ncbi:hypothetical protein IC229_12375 [Spirosoma sp. BT702]|uniref:Uncharacterized protein n=1 Tax=Spirosoma profusum TaxID=2771354 RepID=A0A926XVY4_9BACT|nr:hypothetical protein [Spirosoma profusum]MBD2701439.1 hypothetical protein [Spirosoma profusum]
MNRFSVLYLHHDAYSHVGCATLAEADNLLGQVFSTTGDTPVGIYDAKTELFSWEPVLQQQYNQMSLEEQGRLGHEMIAIVQSLRDVPISVPEQEYSLDVYESESR